MCSPFVIVRFLPFSDLILSATVNGGKLFIDDQEVLGEAESTNGNVVEIALPAYSSDLGLPTQNVIEIARQQGFELFATLFDQAGLLADVQEGGPFTVFAVDDDTLLAAVAEFPELYPEDGAGGNTVSDELRQILMNHVGRAPRLNPFRETTTYYRGVGKAGVSCEGIALPLGPISITLADICLPLTIDTMQVR
jgi:hypothetical protein